MKTQRSCGTPSAAAFSAEHTMTAAAMSTSLLEFMYLVYGRPTIRFDGDGVRISCGVRACCNHAAGLCEATVLNRDHSALIRCRWRSVDRPARARIAVSNIG